MKAICQDREGGLWFGADTGLVRYQDGAVTTFTTGDGLAGNQVKALLEDREGNLWIGTYGGLSRFRDGAFASYTEREGLSSNRVRSLYEDGDGALWVGTYDGGLNRLKDGRITRYTTANGLFNNGVFQILEDAAGNFWMSCNQGIYRVSRRQLDDFAAGRARAITSVSYGKEDGLGFAECNGGRQPAGVRTRDGKLWFPTAAGVAVVDPEKVPRNPQPPPVVIESCLLDREALDSRHRIEIAPGKTNLEIHYTGLSFVKSEHITFRYKLAGVDGDWVEAGTRRAAFYAHLPPGSYTFTVIAANSDGVWNTEGVRLQVTVIPPFYRTWWFLTLLGLAVAGAAVIFFEWRVWRARRAHAAQEAFSRRLIASQESERQRIAAELHDGLGQSLLVIKNRALMGLNKPDDQQAAQRQLGEISASVSQALEEVRGIAHNLRPYQLDRLGLTRALEAIIGKVASASALRLTADLDPIDGLLPPESEINLYRIVQEGLNNIIKHSEAGAARVAVKRDECGVQITIQDDGKGFDLDRADARPAAGHGFGLTGIAERARILGGRCAVQSAPGRGTTITVIIDLPADKKGGSNGR